MALGDIEQMTRPLSEENQVATHASGDDIIQSAILWAAGLPQFGSIDAVVQSLQDGSTDMNGLINAYMDARTEMN